MLIATHCEDEVLMKMNFGKTIAKYGENYLTAVFHPIIRDHGVCYSSSAFAVQLAKKYGTRLHVLHISTANELKLFRNDIPLMEKKITAEACVHHLYFSDKDYETLGNLIKCNPAIKTEQDREAIFNAVLDDLIDVIATDHAPHTWDEKSQLYTKAPSGIPLVQHSLNLMLEFAIAGKISKQKIVEKMCNNPAIMFDIDRRGFIKEGYFADLVLVDMDKHYTVGKENILSKCSWSPFEGKRFHSVITHTFVNGHLAYDNGHFNEYKMGKRLEFNR